MTNFHPDAQWLSEYVAGTLADSQALCVSTHLAFCTQCKKDITERMQLSAALFYNEQTVCNASSIALQQVFSGIDCNHQQPAAVVDFQADAKQPNPHQADLAHVNPDRADPHLQLPQVIKKLIAKGAGNLHWRKQGSKISIAKLHSLGDKHAITLHRLSPGTSLSNHDHCGCEITVVLSGSFSDDDGQYYAGDFLVRTPGETHRPRTNDDEACLCLAVCDAPVKLTGLFTRLLNPFIAYQHKH